MSCVYHNLRHRWLRRLTRKPFLGFFAEDGPLEWVRPIPKTPQLSWHASGASFRPNGRLWTQFEPFSMIWARTDIVDPTWTSRTRPGTAPWSVLDPSQRLRNGPGMLLDQMSSVETRQMSQQESSVLSQQQTSVLSQQKTSILSQQKTQRLPASGRLL